MVTWHWNLASLLEAQQHTHATMATEYHMHPQGTARQMHSGQEEILPAYVSVSPFMTKYKKNNKKKKLFYYLFTCYLVQLLLSGTFVKKKKYN